MKTTYEIQNKYPDEAKWHTATDKQFESRAEVRAWIEWKKFDAFMIQEKCQWRVLRVTREILPKYIWNDDGSDG